MHQIIGLILIHGEEGRRLCSPWRMVSRDSEQPKEEEVVEEDLHRRHMGVNNDNESLVWTATMASGVGSNGMQLATGGGSAMGRSSATSQVAHPPAG